MSASLVRFGALFLLFSFSSGLSAGGFLPDGAFSKNAAGTTAAAFIKDPSGAVFASLGMAGSAYRSPYSVFFNPAGLTGDKMSAIRAKRLKRQKKQKKQQEKFVVVDDESGVSSVVVSRADGNERTSAVGAGYDSMFESYARSALNYSRPLGGGVMGLSLVYAAQDALDGFNTKGDYTGTFNAYDAAAGVSYARTLKFKKGELDAGVTIKYISTHIENAAGSTFAADIGILSRDFVDQGGLVRDLALTVRNLGLPMKMETESEPLPLELSLGVMLDAGDGWYGYLDGKFSCDYSPYGAFGIEFKPLEKGNSDIELGLRAGYNMRKAKDLGGLGGWSAGLGLGFGGLKLDYAWVPMNDLGNTNRFSLMYMF